LTRSPSNDGAAMPRTLPFKIGRLAPHSILFLALNLLYFMPLAALLIVEYSVGGTAAAAALDPETATRIAWVYVAGLLAFLCGSKLKLFHSEPPRQESRLSLFELNGTFRLLCYATIGIFFLSKVLLVPLGVYSQYAFETESMVGGIWSFSMFCSETLLLLSIVVLFSRERRNVKWFLFLSAINAVNLLHGTRIFFFAASFALGLYFYLRGALTFRRASLAALLLMATGYGVHVSRSNAEVGSETISVAGVISPVMYETVFSQLPLIGVVRDSHLWQWFGSPHKFFSDIFYFSAPRFLLPQKDTLLFLGQYSDLSPLGAFSGYAAGLLYFGVLFPVLYFVLGSVASWMLNRARDSSFWSVIYVYFTCDCLLRVMRDGYIIPAKILVNALVILSIAVLFAPVARHRAAGASAVAGSS